MSDPFVVSEFLEIQRLAEGCGLVVTPCEPTRAEAEWAFTISKKDKKTPVHICFSVEAATSFVCGWYAGLATQKN